MVIQIITIVPRTTFEQLVETAANNRVVHRFVQPRELLGTVQATLAYPYQTSAYPYLVLKIHNNLPMC
jgi:hypothetical protein